MHLDDLFNFESKYTRGILLKNRFIRNIINVKSFDKLLKKKEKDNQECHFLFGLLNIAIFLDKYENNFYTTK